ncbi:MAG: glycogen/starch/alpha-glucan phosphorylase, partial [Bacilli bacterium]|nr:glycogen/starch/alpha-glucan phosphorylase [Bacilli bacterium]
MSIIRDGQIHMTNMAIYAGFSVNGVAKIHTGILKEYTFKHFYELFPEKFNNKTNGVTHRRWLLNSNEELANLITERSAIPGSNTQKNLRSSRNSTPIKMSKRESWTSSIRTR